MRRPSKITLFILLIAFLALTVAAQKKANVRTTTTPQPTPEPTIPAAGKRNERPDGAAKKTVDPAISAAPATHFYEFTRPGFTYGKIVIEHDNAGKGKISFLKDGYDEELTDPISLSQTILTKIDEALAELKFLDSTEDYQYIKDYSHLGNVTFTLKQDGRTRTVKYNWTENKGARMLMDEYRRISNEYTWRFEMLLARQNMPLQTPGLMDALEGYMRRNEISDPVSLVPFLKELSNDERLPLIGRNKALKLVGEIEKVKK